MSKTSDARQEPKILKEQQTVEGGEKTGNGFPPFKPRRGLFALFATLLALLFAGMLTMYFTTVYPNRYKPQSVENDRAVESTGRK